MRDQPCLFNDDRPLSPIGVQLRRYRTHRESAFAIAEALRAAAGTTYGSERVRFLTAADRITLCARSCRVHPVTADNEATRLVIRHPCDCKHPLCTLSNRWKSARMRKKIRHLLAVAEELQPGSPLLFLSFTARNRPWGELASMLDDLDAAERRFWRLAEVKRAFMGAITAHEVVCRGTPDDPQAGGHSHALVCGHRDYFDRSSPEPRYLSQQRLTILFQQSLRVDYKPIIHIARVRAADGSVGNAGIAEAVRELIKYCVKPAELFTRDNEHLIADPAVVAVLARALHRRKMLRMTGVFATASRIHNRRQEEATEQD